MTDHASGCGPSAPTTSGRTTSSRSAPMNGRKFRMLNIIDEFTHECLAIQVSRRLKSIDVIDVLSDLFIMRGVPGHVRSDNGPEFVAKAGQAWIVAVGPNHADTTPGHPWQH